MRLQTSMLKAGNAVEGIATHESATAVLLEHFADEHLENAGDGEWKEFLEGLKHLLTFNQPVHSHMHPLYHL